MLIGRRRRNRRCVCGVLRRRRARPHLTPGRTARRGRCRARPRGVHRRTGAVAQPVRTPDSGRACIDIIPCKPCYSLPRHARH
jgi:hypothetical protein